MKKSDVFFMDFRVGRHSLLVKLEKLLDKAGLKTISFDKKFTAIKIHFGEPGNLAYIRPNYARKIGEIIRSLGGRPFLTDSNTLYTGRRANAFDHLESAYENGFNPLATGMHVLIADGLKGADFKEIPVINATHCPKPKIGNIIADADVIISMNHFKGHEQAGFGGALKNLGMGSGSRGGKMEMHSSSQPVINGQMCVSCGQCIRYCPKKAITFNKSKKAEIDYKECIGCGQCIAMCQYDAAIPGDSSATADLAEKIAEYTAAVIQNKPHFHISFITDVSPNCDCWPLNDAPIVPNIGILASFDPVAIDQACADLVNKATPLRGNALTDKHFAHAAGKDKFSCLHPDTKWEAGLAHAEKLGIGIRNYNLTRI